MDRAGLAQNDLGGTPPFTKLRGHRASDYHVDVVAFTRMLAVNAGRKPRTACPQPTKAIETSDGRHSKAGIRGTRGWRGDGATVPFAKLRQYGRYTGFHVLRVVARTAHRAPFMNVRQPDRTLIENLIVPFIKMSENCAARPAGVASRHSLGAGDARPTTHPSGPTSRGTRMAATPRPTNAL